MAASNPTKNLYQKLLAITEEIGKIDKTGRNQQQGYAFIEQAQVVAEVRVQLAKHGVMIIPETTNRALNQVTSSKGTPMTQAIVASRYTLVNADDPTDRMVCEWDAGEALDTSDKATNKAVTASDKYFKMKLFNISDKDDPDASTPEAPAKAPEKLAEPQDEPGELLTTDQITELMTIAKRKGYATKEAAAAFLSKEALMPFTKLPPSQFDSFKKQVISAGWKKPDAEPVDFGGPLE